MKNSPYTINKLGDLSVEQFLSDYWQKKPLVIRHQFPNFKDLVTPEELAGLALEEDVESRIIRQDKTSNTWHVEIGPFEEATFLNLPDSHWTLLVQTLDYWLEEAHQWLSQFHFIPQWRIDDLMVSFATPNGGVGPHIDQYDVFLIQGMGSRRWQIGRPGETLKEHLPHPLLKQVMPFEPIIDCVLYPGDMLYIPPSTPHHGVALDHCLTYSVGFRAPSYHALLEQLLLDLTEQDESSSQRYRDPNPIDDFGSNRLPNSLTLWLRNALSSVTDQQLISAFGKLVTRPKFEAEPSEIFSESEIIQILQNPNVRLMLGDRSRMTYALQDSQIQVFIDGACYCFPLTLENTIQKLASGLSINSQELNINQQPVDFIETVANLVIGGHLTVRNE
jgi:50S ribosomal protein L16 3-hydroxylase